MKKRILCLILTAIMLISSLPLSVFANVSSGNASDSSLYPVNVSSLYSYNNKGVYAMPDNEGYFYLDIALALPEDEQEFDENILVYYRTVDDSAVAEWGDYESVGIWEETYVTLSKANNYKARVVISSEILEDGFLTPKTYNIDERIVTRRFLFELTRVEGKAKLDESKSEIYCNLRAKRYHYQDASAKIDQRNMNNFKFRASRDYMNYLESTINNNFVINDMMQLFDSNWDNFTKNVTFETHYIMSDRIPTISSPEIKYKGVYSDSLNFSFDEQWRNYAQSEWCHIGISMNGIIESEFWDSDGPATFNVYYNYQGEKRLAMTLYLEGEFDDSKFFGWEHAFEYAIEDNKSQKRNDHIDDNFIGFDLYDNDGNIAYKVRKPEDGSVSAVCNQLKDAIMKGYAVEMMTGDPDSQMVFKSDFTAYYLRLPSNFAIADSYSYELISDSTDIDEIRWLQDVKFAFALIGKEEPLIARDPTDPEPDVTKKKYMVTTNVGDFKEGDPLRVIVRFDRPVYFNTSISNYFISAKINGAYPVQLDLKKIIDDDSYHYFACDTWVFECELPDEVKDKIITSLTNMKIEDNVSGIKPYFFTIKNLTMIIDANTS